MMLICVSVLICLSLNSVYSISHPSLQEEKLSESRESYNNIPSYLQLIYNQLQKSFNNHLYDYENQHQIQQNSIQQPLIKIIQRKSTYHEDFGLNILKFNISDLGYPNSIQLILRMKKNAISQIQSHVTVHIKLHNQKMESQRIYWDVEYYSFDIRELIEEGIDELILSISVTKNNRRKYIGFKDVFYSNYPDGPFLLLQYRPIPISISIINNQYKQNQSEERNKIKKRSINPNQLNRKQENGNYYCKREEWLVRPIDVGLDDVIAPEYIDIGYCSGECPFPLINDIFNYTLHSYFIDRHRILRGLSVPESLPNAHCVGVSYKPLMIIEGSQSGGVQSLLIHNEGIVGSCGCRY